MRTRGDGPCGCYEFCGETMSPFEDLSFSAAEFSGTVRLFPLPNLVLFPHVMQPLHIFEPRYRDLMESALAGDRLITMALLEPGWETEYEGRPPIAPMGCLGRVAVHHRLKHGAYNFLLVGLKRVRLLRELPPRSTFREAEVQVCEDFYPTDEIGSLAALQRRLQEAFLRILPDLPQAQDQLDHLFTSEVSLAALTDIVGYMLDISLEQKMALLMELDVYRRAELLLEHLAVVAADTSPGSAGLITYPPGFSSN
jgi:Lon protease-like protein